MKQIKGLFEEIRGSTKHNTFKTYTDKRKLVIMTKKPIPSYTRTEEQDQQRTLFQNAITAWKNLSEEEKQEYAEQARPYALTGYQYFIKQYLSAPAPAEIWYKVTIDNTESSTNLVEYQIRIDVSNDAQFFTDAENKREAIRLYDSDKSTLLSYWIEKFDTANHNAKIWVKVPSIPAGDIKYIYISIDPSRTTDASDGEATFIFFDDLNSGIDNFTHYDSGSIKWLDNELDIDSEADNTSCIAVINTGQFSIPFAIDYEQREIEYYVDTTNWMLIGICKTNPNDGVTNSGHTFLLRHNAYFDFYVDGTKTIDNSPSGITPTTKHTVSLKITDDRILLDLNGENKINWTGSISDTSGYIQFRDYGFHSRVKKLKANPKLFLCSIYTPYTQLI